MTFLPGQSLVSLRHEFRDMTSYIRMYQSYSHVPYAHLNYKISNLINRLESWLGITQCSSYKSKLKPKAEAKPFKFLPAFKRTTVFQPTTQQQTSQRMTWRTERRLFNGLGIRIYFFMLHCSTTVNGKTARISNFHLIFIKFYLFLVLKFLHW